MVPIYFVTTPVLERPEWLKADALASEIGRRQRYDWRIQADLPPKRSPDAPCRARAV
jgi:hypothetical protein